MIRIDTQVHGYKQGHQLLSSSVGLTKADQATVDQLSDVAGPLRPGEDFAPYMSAYPLPSGTRYVLARTWQDKTVVRAGCVRTLSLLIPVADWANAAGLVDFFELLDPSAFPDEAAELSVPIPRAQSLPPVADFGTGELLEALFLEEPKPVAVFDAADAQLIALRLLTALWPAMRKRFAVSTFALSPRKIDGRNFDLVFAPMDARPRFADWSGRRIDGRASHDARHRWTGTIVSRVFTEPLPSLLVTRDASLIDSEEAETAASLRIALLWDELLQKLDRTPAAVLGLLDIADSKLIRDDESNLSLEAAIASATQRAVIDLPAAEAWDFIGAIAKKIQRPHLVHQLDLVASSAATLAKADPAGAVSLLSKLDSNDALEALLPEISEALGAHFDTASEQALQTAPGNVLVRMLSASDKLALRATQSASLIEHLGRLIPELLASDVGTLKTAVLPLLVDEEHLLAAAPLFTHLDQEELANEVRLLGLKNDFAAASFVEILVRRAQKVGGMPSLRDALLTLTSSPGRNRFLRTTLRPSPRDVNWVLADDRLDQSLADSLLVDLLKEADDQQRVAIFNLEDTAAAILPRLFDQGRELLQWVALNIRLPAPIHMEMALRLIPTMEGERQLAVARRTLEISLGNHFAGDEIETTSMLLGLVGPHSNLAWAVGLGLARDLSWSLVARNLQAYARTSEVVRKQLLESVGEMARAISHRHPFELNAEGAGAFAKMLWDSEIINSPGQLEACAILLPVLLRSEKADISILVAAAFPPVYRELARQNEVPDLFKFIPFLDWDRCKAARRDLVSAFVASPVWAPWHLALTGCLSSDVERILGRLPKSYGWEAYLERLSSELHHLPENCRDHANEVIMSLRSGRHS